MRGVLAAALVLSIAGACRAEFDKRAADAAPDAADPDAAIDAPGPIMCGTKIAEPVGDRRVIVGTNRFATSEFAGVCGGANAPESVYLFDLPPGLSALQIEVLEPPASYFPVVHLRNSCDSSFIEIDCAPDFDEADVAEIRFERPPAGQYFLFVDGFDGDDPGLFELELTVLAVEGASCDPASANDRCDQELECRGDPATCVPATCDGANTRNGYFTVTGSTVDQPELHRGTCSDGGDRAPETIFVLSLTAEVFVDGFGSEDGTFELTATVTP